MVFHLHFIYLINVFGISIVAFEYFFPLCLFKNVYLLGFFLFLLLQIFLFPKTQSAYAKLFMELVDSEHMNII